MVESSSKRASDEETVFLDVDPTYRLVGVPVLAHDRSIARAICSWHLLEIESAKTEDNPRSGIIPSWQRPCRDRESMGSESDVPRSTMTSDSNSSFTEGLEALPEVPVMAEYANFDPQQDLTQVFDDLDQE